MNYRAYDKQKGEYWEDTPLETLVVDSSGKIFIIFILMRTSDVGSKTMYQKKDVTARFDIEDGSGEADINGVEIFIGDIIAMSHCKQLEEYHREVWFKDGMFIYGSGECELYLINNGEKYEIIGTIHDKDKP